MLNEKNERIEADQIAKNESWPEAITPPFSNKEERVYKIDHNTYITYYKPRHKGAFWKVYRGKKREGIFSKDLQIKIGG